MKKTEPGQQHTHKVSPPLEEQVPKLCGGDIELGNFVFGLNHTHETGFEASRALLTEIPGLSTTNAFSWSSEGWSSSWPSPSARAEWSNLSYAQDWGRTWLPISVLRLLRQLLDVNALFSQELDAVGSHLM